MEGAAIMAVQDPQEHCTLGDESLAILGGQTAAFDSAIACGSIDECPPGVSDVRHSVAGGVIAPPRLVGVHPPKQKGFRRRNQAKTPACHGNAKEVFRILKATPIFIKPLRSVKPCTPHEE